ncbi:MAG: phosphate--AMP phosphotransferase, partial [Oscillospiraceae bacterium]|nr:phosphate--AMP phosphotransferase [Oscillospiraceae bacterium]
MLEKAVSQTVKKSALQEMNRELRDSLPRLQLKIKEQNRPVILVFEGWEASGKGSVIASVIKYLDPRFF